MARYSVLLVDDEKEFVTTLAERMQMRGLEPKVAFSGEEALEVLEGHIPDIILLDLKMPGIEGLEVLRRVKKSHPQIQVIIVTGHGSERDKATALRWGAYDHLQKPVDINDLVRIMDRAFQKKADAGLLMSTGSAWTFPWQFRGLLGKREAKG
jgi:DNA-binding NtrC family response regulator